jgi:hypothetical protein
MHLAESNYDNAETGCCARLKRDEWDEREITWVEKPFLKDHLRAFLHIPLNFGSVISRDHAAIEGAAAYPADPLWLTDEVSPWGADVLVATDRPVPHREMVTLSGTFLTKVFEGPYRDIGKWIQSMNDYVAKKGRSIHKLYFFYATCPKCAKRFGANQVVLFAKVT